MASGSRAGSGGKILRARRLARVATPYERPIDAASRPQNPNWVSKFIFSPTKVIASTAGKLISSVLGPESSSSSSSYSGSDDDIDEHNDDVINSSLGVDELTKENDGSGTRKEPSVRLESQQNKLLIEQLILQESFSWEECIKLISIIRSRVVEDPVHAEAVGPSEFPNKELNTDMPNLLNAALMEAKKWLKDKKKGLNQEIEMECDTGGVDPNMSPNAAVGEVGSPVDVARSYMKERPPWASPCFTTPNRAPFFMEDMPVSAGDNYLLYPKVRDPAMSGSWNISEEIRRVRSKATEEMLRTPSTKFDLSKSKLKSLSSAKFDWSGTPVQHKNGFDSCTANDLEVCLGDKAHASTNLNDASPRTEALDVARQAFATTMCSSRQDNGTPIVNPPVLTSEKDQDLEDNMIPADQDGLLDASGNPGGSNQHHGNVILDSRVSDGVCSMSKEDLCTDGGGPSPTSANGFPHLSSSLKPTKDMEEGERISSYDEELRQKKLATPPVVEQITCELLSEASVQVPNVNENESGGGGLSQDSSSMHSEEPSSQSQNAAGAAAAAATPKRPKKVIRYVKRTTTNTRGQTRARSSK